MTISAVGQTVTGAGTVGNVPIFTGASTLGNSTITQVGGNVGIGTTNPISTLRIVGPWPFVQIVATGPYGGALDLDTTASGGSKYRVQSTGSNDNTGPHMFLIQDANASYANRLAINAAGNVGIGTTVPGAKLEVDGNVKLTAGSGASITFADGTTQSTAYTGVTCGGDYAESVDVAGARTSYEPGDVLVIGPDSGSDVVKSSEPYSTLVTGVYSTKPGVVGRRQRVDLKASKTEVPMAMIGIVPTKVSAENGPIRRGDLLVTSSLSGFAMKGTDRNRMLGAVIGKALGNLNSGTGVIEAVITLQ